MIDLIYKNDLIVSMTPASLKEINLKVESKMNQLNENSNKNDPTIFEGIKYLMIESQRSVDLNDEDLTHDFNAIVKDGDLFFEYQNFIFKLDLEHFKMYYK